MEIREFNSIDELCRHLDQQIDSLRKQLGELLRAIEESRIRAEQERKLKTLLAKLTGGNVPQTSSVVELGNIKLYINPSAENEITLLEQAAEAINSKMMTLQAIRKDLEALAGTDISATLRVIMIDGVPRAIIVKI